MVQARRREPLTMPTNRKEALTQLRDARDHWQRKAHEVKAEMTAAERHVRRTRNLTRNQRSQALRQIEALARQKLEPLMAAMEHEIARYATFVDQQLFHMGSDTVGHRDAHDRAEDLFAAIAEADNAEAIEQATARLDREVNRAHRIRDVQTLQALAMLAHDRHHRGIEDYSNVFAAWRDHDPRAAGYMDASDVFDAYQQDASDLFAFTHTVSLEGPAQEQAEREMAEEAWQETQRLITAMGLDPDQQAGTA
jgi:hypothetical protein